MRTQRLPVPTASEPRRLSPRQYAGPRELQSLLMTKVGTHEIKTTRDSDHASILAIAMTT